MKRSRRQLIEILVLNAVSDDFEDFAKILRDVTKDGEKCGIPIGPDSVVLALTDIIERGWVKPYILRPTCEPPEEILVRPVEIENGDYYYGITELGKLTQTTPYAGWPFDAKGQVRMDWLPPDD